MSQTTARRVAIVSGGAQGIGRACVCRLAAEGHTVLFSDIDADAGQRTERECPNSLYVPGDASDPHDVKRVVELALEKGEGSLYGVVNNVGQAPWASFRETTVEDWDRVFAVNTRSAFLLTQYALDGLIAGRGAVVMVASVAGKVGHEGLAAYAATKAALIAFAQSLAVEFGYAVRFNVVCPGQIETRIQQAVKNPELRPAVEQRIPVGRLGQPDEVASVIALLLSPSCSYVNGVVVAVDGGETAGIQRVRA